MIKIPLNQQIAEGMDISPDGMYAGVELKQHRPERFEMVSVKDLTGLDDTEGGVCRRLDPSAGIGLPEQRSETVTVTGERCCPDRKYGNIIEVSLFVCGILIGALNCRIYVLDVYVTRITCPVPSKDQGQKGCKYEDNTFHMLTRCKSMKKILIVILVVSRIKRQTPDLTDC